MAHNPAADDLLRGSVLQALAGNLKTASLDLRVGVLNGVVHLGGAAPSEALWRLAQAIAAEIPGVRGVVNRIEAPGAPSPSRVINIPLGEQGRNAP